MEEIQKNIDVKIAEFERLQKAIKAFKEELVLVNEEYETAEDSKVEEAVTLEEQDLVSVFADKKISDFWWGWQEQHKDTNYWGFVDFNMPNRLEVGRRYDFEIGPVTVVGETIQLLILLFDIPKDDEPDFSRPAGLLIESYKFGSVEFMEMVKHVFAQWHEGIIAVDIDRISEAVGNISVKMNDGKFAIDWASFDPEQTPISEACDFGIALADRIKKASA